MNPKSNKDLTTYVADPSHGNYVGATQLKSAPTGANGKSGDYYFAESGANGASVSVDQYGRSLYFKVGTQWIRLSTFAPSAADASVLSVQVDACSGIAGPLGVTTSNPLSNIELTNLVTDVSGPNYIGQCLMGATPNANKGKSGDYFFDATGQPTSGLGIFYFKVGSQWITVDASGVTVDGSLGSEDDYQVGGLYQTGNDPKNNQQLTDIIADPSKSNYIGAVNLTSVPTTSTGKSGDYYFDGSLYFKVGSQWLIFDNSALTVLE